MYYYFFFFLLFCLFFKLFHLMSFLLGAEMMVLFLVFLMALAQYHEYLYLFLVFISFSVSESVLGLVLFVMYVRVFSKDYLYGLSVLKF